MFVVHIYITEEEWFYLYSVKYINQWEIMCIIIKQIPMYFTVKIKRNDREGKQSRKYYYAVLTVHMKHVKSVPFGEISYIKI